MTSNSVNGCIYSPAASILKIERRKTQIENELSVKLFYDEKPQLYPNNVEKCYMITVTGSAVNVKNALDQLGALIKEKPAVKSIRKIAILCIMSRF